MVHAKRFSAAVILAAALGHAVFDAHLCAAIYVALQIDDWLVAAIYTSSCR
jgi:hypothetical protein